TDAGPIEAEINDATVKINLGPPKDLRADFALRLDEKREFNASFINTGVPHAMILVREAERIDVQDMGSKIRYHKEFAPAGTNVNFVQTVDEHHLIVRTYERGVEGE